jgi:hypothetical protein
MKPRNYVAKFQHKYNKAKVFLDRKKEAKKHGLDDYVELDEYNTPNNLHKK